jgi:hypothetical protein
MGTASALYTFILENFWTKFGLKLLFGTLDYGLREHRG